MGRKTSKRRTIASVVALAIFLVISSFIGSALMAADARADGLDVEWRVPLTTGFDQVMTASDGSFMIRETGGPIDNIDRNGTVKWAYNVADSSQMSLGSDGRVYFVERLSDGNNSLDCLLGNGTLDWKFETDKVLQNVQIGPDGNIYFNLNPGYGSSLVCITPDGLVAWEYGPVVGDLSGYPFIVSADGNVLVRNVVVNWSNSVHPEGSWVSTFDHLVSISKSGMVRWEKDVLTLMDGSILCNGPFIRGNSTPLLILYTNSSQKMLGLDREGSVIWTRQSEHSGFPGTAGPDNVVFYLDEYQDQPWGYPVHEVTAISSWNTSSGALNWQKVFEGGAYGPLAMSDNESLFLLDGELVKMGSDGAIIWRSGIVFNYITPQTILADDGNCGILTVNGATLRMIDGNGRQSWQFQLDAPVKAGSLGKDGSIIVMTNDYLIFIGHPVLTTTMNYFVVLLAIDLFVTLMGVVSVADRIWPQDKARVE